MSTETLIETFNRLRHKLHRAATVLLNDEAEAEDAVQDAFCNLWNTRMPHTSAEARNRLFVVVRNICINKLKSRRNKINIDEIELSVDDIDTGDAERLRAIALAALTPLQRRIFELAVADDMDYPEIATELGLTVEAVRMNMSRARKKIKDTFTDLNI